jgi:hypothetical protein
MLGIRFWGVDPGPLVRYHPPQLGGNIRVGRDGRLGIHVVVAVFDVNAPKAGDLTAWRSGSWKDRIDAVVAHEFAEVSAPDGGDFHSFALATADRTRLAVTARARQILQEYREADGL